MNPTDDEQAELLKAKITGETAKIPWRELQRFFAQGRAIAVAEGVDLVEVAGAITEDQADAVKTWMESGKLDNVSDEQALAWFEADALVWAVVIRPWVLVQSAE